MGDFDQRIGAFCGHVFPELDIEALEKPSPGVPCIIKAQLPQTYQAQGVFEDGITGRFKRARSSEEAVDMSKKKENLRSVLRGLCQVFKSKDVTSLEVYPIINAIDETITCVDTKITIDDAASKRQEDIFALRDRAHGIAEEAEAEKYGLVYVKMDGNIGNVVNGAGLAMATNDAIALHGGASANFLDAGGQATKETMVKAFEIILRDTRVKTILVNIYGGITRGDMIAESIIGAATELGPLKVPMVVRLQGTNSELGLKMLAEAKLGLYTEADFGKAAQKAVELARSAT
ncbi:hypothetical protein K4K58_002469 [Colletotrichum sp. SAR11_239]|nr:hypothetical protein K4K58_002469 [Colletotrichum sp. SAR11_239]